MKSIKIAVLSFPVLLLSIFLSPASSAHTALLSSTPESGATVREFPATVAVTFSQELLTLGGSKSNFLQLISPGGRTVRLGEMLLNKATISAEVIERDQHSGRYSISYRVVAGDGHVIRGKVDFDFKPKKLSTPEEETPSGVVEGDSEELEEDGGNSTSVYLLVGLIVLTLFSILLIYRRSSSVQ